MAVFFSKVCRLFVSPAKQLQHAHKLRAENKHAEAFPLLAEAARAGSPEAAYLVGRCYMESQGVPPSLSEGVSWVERAALAGHVEALFYMAVLSMNGMGAAGHDIDATLSQLSGVSLFGNQEPGKQDFDRALGWASKAASAGSADAQALKAHLLTHGPETMRDMTAAATLYRQSADAGCAAGCLGHAQVLLRTATLFEHHAAAVVYLQRAADANMPMAQYLLGLLFEHGQGVSADPEHAVELYAQAAKQGLSVAQARYGAALMHGKGVERDLVDGETWLRRAAMQGDSDSAALVGDLYAQDGGSLPPNHTEAATWYRRATDLGHRQAARSLGLLYINGVGIVHDEAEAARLFRQAATGHIATTADDLAHLAPGDSAPGEAQRTQEQFAQAASIGDLLAAFNYGVCLAQGVGVERNDVEAAKWLRRAADGVVEAQFWYGRLLAEGRGVAADAVEGREWIARAAEAGFAEAQVMFGEMLVTARGGPADHPRAQALFQKAAATGHVGAMFALGALAGGGYGVPSNLPEAQSWFRQAAESHHALAQMMLGRYLARGVAGEQNSDEARLWLTKSRDQGVAEAQADLDALKASA